MCPPTVHPDAKMSLENGLERLIEKGENAQQAMTDEERKADYTKKVIAERKSKVAEVKKELAQMKVELDSKK